MTAPERGDTAVDLVWIEGRIERWIRFGRAKAEVLQDRRRRTLTFAPGSVFALVRWAAGDYGTVQSELDILVAPAVGAPMTTRPGVRPGAEVLAALSGWTRVQWALAVIDAAEAWGMPAHRVAPDYWRHVHNRLSAGLAPRAYDRVRHRAWLLRRRLQS